MKRAYNKAMKGSDRITQFASRADYLKKAPMGRASKKLAQGLGAKKDAVKGGKEATRKALQQLKEDALQTAKTAGTHQLINGLIKGVTAQTLAPNRPPSLPPGPLDKNALRPVQGETIEKKAFKMQDLLKPSIFIVTGFEWGGLLAEDKGLVDLTGAVPQAKRFKWDQSQLMLQEIKKMPKLAPLILVGHSLGGDGVVDMANKLNTLEYGFKKVDLLVTLDSVGFDNDIIPSNVLKNVNFIGDRDMLFNDGPNIARSNNKTQVINELRSEDHRGIDDSKEVQLKIFSEIEEVLNKHDDFLKMENEKKGQKWVADLFSRNSIASRKVNS